MKGWRSPNDGPRDPLIFPVVSLKVSGAWNNDVRKLQGLIGTLNFSYLVPPRSTQVAPGSALISSRLNLWAPFNDSLDRYSSYHSVKFSIRLPETGPIQKNSFNTSVA